MALCLHKMIGLAGREQSLSSQQWSSVVSLKRFLAFSHCLPLQMLPECLLHRASSLVTHERTAGPDLAGSLIWVASGLPDLNVHHLEIMLQRKRLLVTWAGGKIPSGGRENSYVLWGAPGSSQAGNEGDDSLSLFSPSMIHCS